MNEVVDLDLLNPRGTESLRDPLNLLLGSSDLLPVLANELDDDLSGSVDGSGERREDPGGSVSGGDLPEGSGLDEVSEESLGVGEGVEGVGGRSVEGSEIEGLDGDGVGLGDDLREG